MSHGDIAGCRCVRCVGLGRGNLKVGLVVAGMAEAVNDITDLDAGGMRAGIVDGNALEAGPLQRIPDSFGIVGEAVEAVDQLVAGFTLRFLIQNRLPSGDAMRPGMGAGRKGGPSWWASRRGRTAKFG